MASTSAANLSSFAPVHPSAEATAKAGKRLNELLAAIAKDKRVQGAKRDETDHGQRVNFGTSSGYKYAEPHLVFLEQQKKYAASRLLKRPGYILWITP